MIDSRSKLRGIKPSFFALDNKETRILKAVIFSIIWFVGLTTFTGIYQESIFDSRSFTNGGWEEFYYTNENIVYILPLVVGIIFIVKKFCFPKVTLTKSVDAKLDKNLSNADELKKYSDLRDQGIITEEEFQAKKKKLLDL